MAGTQYWGVVRLGTTQHVAYTGTAGEITNAVGGQTMKVRVVCTTDAFVRIGAPGDTANTNDAYIVALDPEYFTCTPGQKVSAMQVASNGTLYVTECV
jgi:hypothetical protein